MNEDTQANNAEIIPGINRALTIYEKRAFIAVVGNGKDTISVGARRMRRRDANHYGILSLALLYSIPMQSIIDAGESLKKGKAKR